MGIFNISGNSEKKKLYNEWIKYDNLSPEAVLQDKPAHSGEHAKGLSADTSMLYILLLFAVGIMAMGLVLLIMQAL